MVMALDTMDTTDPPMDMDIEDIGEKKKREAVADPNAEANADPWYSYYGHGLGHYGYRPYYRSYYRPYGYGYWGRKKREAEAEPEAVVDPNAEANADPWYSYYGYGLGHYGYRPYYRSYYRPYGYGYW